MIRSARRFWRYLLLGGMVVAFATACGGGNGPLPSRPSSGVEIRGTIDIPVSGGPLTVESGPNSDEAGNDNRFRIHSTEGSTQTISVMSGDNPVGLVVIPHASSTAEVVVSSRSTAVGLVFLAPFVAEGTSDGDADVLERIDGLSQIETLAQVIDDGLSREPGYLANLAASPDPEFANAYLGAYEAYLASPVSQSSTNSNLSLVSNLPLQFDHSDLRLGTNRQESDGISVTPAEASGVSLSVASEQDSTFTARNSRRRYVDIYRGGARIAELDAPGWMNLYQPRSETFTLSNEGEESIALEAYGPGLRNIPARGTPEFSRLLRPTIGSVVFLTVLPALDALLGVADIGKLTLFQPLIGEVLTDSGAIAEITEAYVNGKALEVTIAITKVVLRALEADFRADPAGSILARYAGRAAASALVGNWLVWLRVGMTALTGVDIVAALGAYATSNASDTFTVTFNEDVTPSPTKAVTAPPTTPPTEPPTQPPTSPPTPAPLIYTVDSTIGWQDTGIYLDGQTFSISYIGGSWTVDYTNFSYVGPGGYSQEEDQQIYQGCKIAEGVYATLVGRIGEGPIFVIGTGGSFTIDAVGYLQLSINDNEGCLGDNDGSIEVSINGGVPVF